MPIHEYTCTNCSHEFEALTRAAAPPRCPACESTELEKKLSVFATPPAPQRAAPAGACGTCGHPGGPGSCGPDF
jgi:putative FmdB family regulatory protein